MFEHPPAKGNPLKTTYNARGPNSGAKMRVGRFARLALVATLLFLPAVAVAGTTMVASGDTATFSYAEDVDSVATGVVATSAIQDTVSSVSNTTEFDTVSVASVDSEGFFGRAPLMPDESETGALGVMTIFVIFAAAATTVAFTVSSSKRARLRELLSTIDTHTIDRLGRVYVVFDNVTFMVRNPSGRRTITTLLTPI